MNGYPIINKEEFYKFYEQIEYRYINTAYRESDDSLLLYRDDLLARKKLIFQLVSKDKDEVPEHRKNLYILLKADHDKLRDEIETNRSINKKISAQLLTKFVDPYSLFKIISEENLHKKILDLNLCLITNKAVEYIVKSKKNSEKEIMNLNLAKEMLDKRISYLKTNK